MIEVPESLCLFIHGCLDFVYLCHDFDSHFLKETIYFLFVRSIRLFSFRERSDLLQELEVIWERPVPEDGLEVTGCELGNGKEIFRLKGLFNDAEFAFEDTIICASRISGEIDAFLVFMVRTEFLNRWLLTLSLSRIITCNLIRHFLKIFVVLFCK